MTDKTRLRRLAVWTLAFIILMFTISTLLIHYLFKRCAAAEGQLLELMTLGNDLQSASDRLSEESRQVALTFDLGHVEKYLEELELDRNRERVLERVHAIPVDTQDHDLIEQAKAASDRLVETELRAIRLMVSAQNTPSTGIPETIAAVRLNRADELLKPEAKAELARSILFDETYRLGKRLISEPIVQFQNNMRIRMDREIQWIGRAILGLTILQIGMGILIVLVVFGLIRHFFSQYILPIEKLGRWIKTVDFEQNQRLDVSGSMEVALLVESFNQMTRTLRRELLSRRRSEAGLTLAKNDLEEAVVRMQLEVDRRKQLEEKATIQRQTVEARMALEAAMTGLNNCLRGNIPLQDLLDQSLKYVVDFLGGSNAAVYLVDESKAVLLRACYTPSGQPEAINRTGGNTDRELVIQEVVETGRAVITTDATHPETAPSGQKATAPDLTVNLPIRYQDENLGVLEISFPESLPADQLDWLIQATSQISMAIRLALDNEQRQQMEIELVAARDLAEQASKAKADFLANMSHEIRTPLNAIMGMTRMILQSGLNDQQLNYMNKLQTSSQHLLGLINDILDFSKVDADKLVLEQVDFKLNEVLETATELVSGKAAEKGLALIVDVDPTVPACLRGDPLRLGQILINLLTNAVKFTEHGTVRIQIRMLEDLAHEIILHCAVHDTGIGLSDVQLDTLFTSFSQGDSSTTRKYGGTGLGLAISKRLATLMGGDIGASSQPGEGSIFWFTVRVGKGSELSQSSAKTDLAEIQPVHDSRVIDSHDLVGRRILIVEDNAVNQEIAQQILLSAGLHVELANNGEQAVDAILDHGHQIDLVLMDMHMPVLDGLAATRQIRLDPRFCTLPIIALTANAMQGDREICEQAGMNDYICKPIDVQQLLGTISRWIKPRPAGENGLSDP